MDHNTGMSRERLADFWALVLTRAAARAAAERTQKTPERATPARAETIHAAISPPLEK